MPPDGELLVVELHRTRALVGQRWWWRVVAPNGETLATSERYRRRIDAEHAIHVLVTASFRVDRPAL